MRVGRELDDWMSGVYAFYLLSYLAVLGLHYCAGSSLVVGAILHCSVWASHCSDFSCCKAQALGRLGFSSCRTWLSSFNPRASEHKPIVVVHGLSRVAAYGIFLDQGLNLVSCTGSWILYH